MKTLMHINLEYLEDNGLLHTEEFKEFINHSRVYLNDNDETVVYYAEDKHSFAESVNAEHDVVVDLEAAGYYMSISHFVPHNYITVDYISIVKDLLEAEYAKDEKPSFDIKEWVEERMKEISVIYLQKIIKGIEDGTVRVTL